jgi:hypothetical protein
MTNREFSMPADEDGFISRECPTCIGTFKAQVLDGAVTVHFCPYCRHEGDDCWWTPEQLDFIQKASAEAIRPELEAMVNQFKAQSSGLIQFKAELSPPTPAIIPEETADTKELHTFPCCGAHAKIERSRLVDTGGQEAKAYCIMCGSTNSLDRI